jgi:hypothetical protein
MMLRSMRIRFASFVTGIVCSSLSGRWSFDALREVRLALFQEGRKRFLASSERTCALNSSFSAFIAALICSRNGCFMSLLLACRAPAGFAASFWAVAVAVDRTS